MRASYTLGGGPEPSTINLHIGDRIILTGITPPGGGIITHILPCHYCGGSGLSCCEHSSDSPAELNKRVREGAD